MPETLPQFVESQRQTIRAHLERGLAQAAATGRPLAILLGEAHGDKHANLNNTLVIDEARRLGINTVGTETTPEMDRQYRGTLSRESILTMSPSIFPSMQHTPIDMARMQASGSNASPSARDAMRDRAMAENISGFTGHSVSIIGNMHLHGVEQNLADRTVLSFNASPADKDGRNTEQYLQRNPHHAASIRHLRSDNIIQLATHPATAQHSNRTLLGLAVGQEHADKAIDRLSARGFTNDEAAPQTSVPTLPLSPDLSTLLKEAGQILRSHVSAIETVPSHNGQAPQQTPHAPTAAQGQGR